MTITDRTIGNDTTESVHSVDLLMRAADAGDTFVSWRWLDDVETPHAERLDTAVLVGALDRLDRALITATEGEDPEHAVVRALTEGAFTDIAAERRLATELTAAALPATLARQIRDRLDLGLRIRLRLTPSPRLARIPWELLVLDGDTRLIEAVDISYDPPATVHADRSCRPIPWTALREHPALFVIDPELPPRAGIYGYRRGLDSQDETAFEERLGEHETTGGADRRAASTSIGQMVTRIDLSEQLRHPTRSRLFYLGHVSSTHDEPGTASMHLYDTASTWGLTEPVRRGIHDPAAAIGPADPQDHRPLSALDLMLGTTMTADPKVWRLYDADAAQRGHLIWPMPPRVAVIACEGGADFRSTETFGLVMAMLDAGAELVTTTRWTLPTDTAIRRTHPTLPPDTHPTVDLALEVDTAHTLDDPISHLARWQRTQLQRWRETGDIRYSPLVWASLTHTNAPDRPD